MGLLSCFSFRGLRPSRSRRIPPDGASNQASTCPASAASAHSPACDKEEEEEEVASAGVPDKVSGQRTSVAPLEPSSVVEGSPFELLAGLKLGKALGRGAYGYVLQGLWQGTPVAVKVMVTDTLDRAVLRELLVGPHMHHPNVVHTYFTRCARLTRPYFDYIEAAPPPEHYSIHDFDSGDGFGNPQQAAATMLDPVGPFHQVLYELKARAEQYVTLVAMEFCDKTTLGMAAHTGLFHAGRHWNDVVAKRALLRSAQEVARGMIHLHNSGVVHGDLKPGNVLLKGSRTDRRGFKVKLADFGLAHRLLAGARYASTSNSYGTVAYMAPEGFLGKVGLPSDVYSFGAMLWELLYRELPFKKLKYGEVVRGMIAGALALEWRECHVVPELVELGKCCVDPDPEKRPTFVQVEAELVRIETQLRADAELVKQQNRQHRQAAAAARAPAGVLGSVPQRAAPQLA